MTMCRMYVRIYLKFQCLILSSEVHVEPHAAPHDQPTRSGHHFLLSLHPNSNCVGVWVVQKPPGSCQKVFVLKAVTVKVSLIIYLDSI